jgi:hypothetical protein
MLDMLTPTIRNVTPGVHDGECHVDDDSEEDR